MKANEALGLMSEPRFLDKIYQYAYRRCNTSFEAEDLCSDIVLAVIRAIKKRDINREYIENFHAFVWTVAKRVYADHCEKQSKHGHEASIDEHALNIADSKDDISELIEESSEKEQLKRIFKEIAFLSKVYRDVMVMFYIDEMKIKDIAQKLGTTETAVKQRLFSARNTVKKEVEKVDNRNLSLKPIRFKYTGTGSPNGNDPGINATRLLSQNLIYLCKDKAKSAKELSEELCVPMPYIEEELEYQCHGWNGEYGMLKRLENGKYISNIIIADREEQLEAAGIYEKYLSEVCTVIKAKLEKDKDAILSFPFFSRQKDITFVGWLLVQDMTVYIHNQVWDILKNKYFADVTLSKRPYTQSAVAYTQEYYNENSGREVYGCDGINAGEIGGYKKIFISNIYGPRLDPYFRCDHNISIDSAILMTIRAIGGLEVNSLDDAEKEIAAKAIEAGYLRKNGDTLEPNIVAYRSENEPQFHSLAVLDKETEAIAEKIAKELADFIKAHLPSHLMGDCLFYASLIASSKFQSAVIDRCISQGILCDPDTAPGAGIKLITTK